MQYRKYYICIIIHKIYYYISNYNKYYTTVLFLINSEVFPSIFLFYIVSPAQSTTLKKTAPKQRPRPSATLRTPANKTETQSPGNPYQKNKIKIFYICHTFDIYFYKTRRPHFYYIKAFIYIIKSPYIYKRLFQCF